MYRELLDAGENVSRKLVRKLMREHGIRSFHTPRFHKTTDSNHSLGFAPNLLAQDLATTAPDRVWVGDITYVWTAEGWTYLAILLDLYSRRVVGWAMADTLHTELPLRALQRALEARGPAPGLIHHSDSSSQYAAHEYRTLLAKWQVSQSMSGTGNCYDNAVAESFFASLKKERLHHMVFATRTEAYDAVQCYIDGLDAPPFAAWLRQLDAVRTAGGAHRCLSLLTQLSATAGSLHQRLTPDLRAHLEVHANEQDDTSSSRRSASSAGKTVG